MAASVPDPPEPSSLKAQAGQALSRSSAGGFDGAPWQWSMERPPSQGSPAVVPPTGGKGCTGGCAQRHRLHGLRRTDPALRPGGGVSKLYGERGCEGANRLRSCQPLTEVRGSETDNLEGAWQWFHFGMTLRSSRDDGVLVAPAAAFPDTQQDHNQTASRSGGNLWANRGGREPVNPPVAQPEARRSSTPNERVGHHRIA